MSKRITVIEPRSGWRSLNMHELWQYRELFFTFVWRDVKVRYKQTIIGVIWALLQPILMIALFTIFFGILAKIPSNNLPYPVFALSGLLFWNYFISAITGASNSLVDNENVIKKIYFPRLILPLSSSITPLVDFAISTLLLIVLLQFFGLPISIGLLAIPFLIVLVFLVASGLGMFFSAVNIRYRDVRHALPFFLQALLFATPVIYSTSLVPERWQWVLRLNPLTGIIETARSVILQNESVNWAHLGISIILAILIYIFGIAYFRRTESAFADVA